MNLLVVPMLINFDIPSFSKTVFINCASLKNEEDKFHFNILRTFKKWTKLTSLKWISNEPMV